jgi:hypothetical protein
MTLGPLRKIEARGRTPAGKGVRVWCYLACGHIVAAPASAGTPRRKHCPDCAVLFPRPRQQGLPL